MIVNQVLHLIGSDCMFVISDGGMCKHFTELSAFSATTTCFSLRGFLFSSTVFNKHAQLNVSDKGAT